MTRARTRGSLVAGVAAVLAALSAVVACSSSTPAKSAGDGPRTTGASTDDLVHLNQIQVVGSHNSYHQLTTAAETKLRQQFVGAAGDVGVAYRHAPLAEQLQSQKVREVELDVWLDSTGGRFATPLLRSATGGGPTDPVMRRPGIKVFHTQDTDYHSSCLTLQICLRQIKQWSDAHRDHVPVAILVELKDRAQSLGNIPFAKPEPWTPAAMNTLDAEIRAVFSPSDMITPDDVRGSRPTLRDAVLRDGWPTLRESRGKVLFLMDNAAKRSGYLQGHPSLAGRVLFTNAVPGQADAAFIERNDAKTAHAEIRSLVRQGYVVRTMADHETREARANDVTGRDAALASGAQWVSTDYPVPNDGVGFATRYVVRLPGGTVARCNPVNRPARCVSADLDTVFEARASTTAPVTTG